MNSASGHKIIALHLSYAILSTPMRSRDWAAFLVTFLLLLPLLVNCLLPDVNAVEVFFACCADGIVLCLPIVCLLDSFIHIFFIWANFFLSKP
jgi:hypothetical protein